MVDMTVVKLSARLQVVGLTLRRDRLAMSAMEHLSVPVKNDLFRRRTAEPGFHSLNWMGLSGLNYPSG